MINKNTGVCIPGFLFKLTRLHIHSVQCIFRPYPHWRKPFGNKFVNWDASVIRNLYVLIAWYADGILNINQQVKLILEQI